MKMFLGNSLVGTDVPGLCAVDRNKSTGDMAILANEGEFVFDSGGN
jgi:hypothetical protein